jgi:hypothetical protein
LGELTAALGIADLFVDPPPLSTTFERGDPHLERNSRWFSLGHESIVPDG